MSGRAVDADVLVIGAGLGGLYAVHSLRQRGLTVMCLEAAPDLGGVWYHNNYPGARVDLESETFCYLFDEQLYRDWKWSERYAAQSEILAYLNHFADRYDLRPLIQFDTRVASLTWLELENRYEVRSTDGTVLRATFVVLATGQLSAPRTPGFDGLAEYGGDWLRASDWPKSGVDLRGRRVGVIGTGSSGVQVATALADQVDELWVFQRTPNYSVPAQNRGRSDIQHEFASGQVKSLRQGVFGSAMGFLAPPPAGRWSDFDNWDREQLLEERWAYGGQPLLRVFTDQGVDWEANTGVGDFVRRKIRERIGGRSDLASLIPGAYPVGTRRLCVDTGYYEQFLKDHVHLVDVRDRPIQGFVREGISVEGLGDIGLDAVVFALGFDAFTGALFGMDIVGRDGERLKDAWARGPRSLYGVMVHGFPNLFVATGPGSPSVLANMFAANVQHMDFIGDLITRVQERGATTIEPDSGAELAWSAHVQDVAKGLIRYHVDNYFVHRNADGSKVYFPYTGGFARYIGYCDEEISAGLPNFVVGGEPAGGGGGHGAWGAA